MVFKHIFYFCLLLCVFLLLLGCVFVFFGVFCAFWCLLYFWCFLCLLVLFGGSWCFLMRAKSFRGLNDLIYITTGDKWVPGVQSLFCYLPILNPMCFTKLRWKSNWRFFSQINILIHWISKTWLSYFVYLPANFCSTYLKGNMDNLQGTGTYVYCLLMTHSNHVFIKFF